MKRWIAAIAMGVAVCAQAAGLYDGVYQSTLNPQVFYSLHQNGSTLLMTSYSGVPTDGSIFLLYGGQKVTPPTIYLWEVQTGQIIGNTAVVSGGTLQNACNVSIQLEMSPASIVGRILASSQSPLGAAQNTPCGLLLPVGFSTQANRMF